MSRAVVVVMVMVAAVGLAGCGDRADPAGPAPESSAEATGDPGVVSDLGLAGIRFGDTRADLARDHDLQEPGPGECAPTLPEHPQASPVFHAGRLVLLWVDPPLHTPAGIMVGSPVPAARAAYPGAEELAAPPESYRFDGLLAPVGDRAYLFLHDGERVQKVIVGYQEYARALFEEGFGTC